ncbi:MAG: SDR family oxidoreductase [Pseudomonadota bacterium]
MAAIDFTERVAIVTGAGAGLGRDYAIELAKRGAKVVVNDLGGTGDGKGSSQAAADRVADEIKAAGGTAVPNYDDVSIPAGGENIVNTALDNFGRVDILINNAGILRDKSFVKMDEETWDVVLKVHLKGTYNVTRPAFTHMREHRYGRIVVTSSISGLIGNFGQSNYAAAKVGLAGLVNVLKLEGDKYNIKVNVIVPTAGTRLTANVMPSEMFEQLKPEHVTPAVLYLCSEQCRDSGRYIKAMNGYYSRLAIVIGPGRHFEKMPTPEEIMANWDKITDLEGAKFFNDVNEFMAFVVGSRIQLQ